MSAGVRVLSKRCETCIFHPGNRMHLQPGRVRQMVDSCRRLGRHIVCHEFLSLRGGGLVFGPRATGAVCRGFWESVTPRSQALQVAERLDRIEWIEPPMEVEVEL